MCKLADVRQYKVIIFVANWKFHAPPKVIEMQMIKILLVPVSSQRGTIFFTSDMKTSLSFPFMGSHPKLSSLLGLSGGF